MVAVINTGASIRSTFFYNEHKVEAGVAVCIMAQNYPMEMDDMTQGQRLNMLLKMAERNPYVKRQSMHISLNFAPEEHHTKDKLALLADEYMERIGFGKQPFLVYQHMDSGHPHIHIVTTKIKSDGSCIDTHNIGRNQSETARKAMEIKYGLVRAEDHKASVLRMQPADASKVQYGKQTTTKAIADVLNEVLGKYKYTTLAELNAVLQLYNVIADRGTQESRTFKTGGLLYRIINKDGDGVSAPIKASSFYMKPTLKNLESRYLKNDVERQQYKPKLKSAVGFIINNKKPKSIRELSEQLFKQQIRLVERRNEDGFLYGVTFVDLKNKVVFNGSDLGKEYSAAALLERYGKFENAIVSGMSLSGKQQVKEFGNDKAGFISTPKGIHLKDKEPEGSTSTSLLDQLMQAEYGSNYLPFELRRTPKKKKRKKSNRL